MPQTKRGMAASCRERRWWLARSAGNVPEQSLVTYVSPSRARRCHRGRNPHCACQSRCVCRRHSGLCRGDSGPGKPSPRNDLSGRPDPPDSLILFNFEDAGKAQWSVESDRVMGGRSSGSAQVAGGTLTFTGEVVTEGGGFSSVRVDRQVDLSGYDGIELRVRGGGGARLSLMSTTEPVAGVGR